MATPGRLVLDLGEVPTSREVQLRLRGVHHQAASLLADVYLVDAESAEVPALSPDTHIGILGLYGHGELLDEQPDAIVAGLQPFDVLLDARAAAAHLRSGATARVIVVPRDADAGSGLRIDGARLEPFPRQS